MTLQPLISGFVPMQNSAVDTRLPGSTEPFSVTDVGPTAVAGDTVATGGLTTDIVNTFESSWLLASVTRTVKELLPTVVGMPDTVPVEPSRLKPPGSEPAITVQEYGAVPPAADRVFE
jgi:hypothetical protein